MSSCKPLYKKYPSQTRPQDCYISIDCDGNVTAAYNPEIGNAVPANVWHGLTLRYGISPYLTSDMINALIAEIIPLAEKLNASSEIAWDGSNHVRIIKNAQVFEKTEMEIIEIIATSESFESEHCGDDQCESCNQ